jgi:hypothetical protein
MMEEGCPCVLCFQYGYFQQKHNGHNGAWRVSAGKHTV